MASLIWLLGAVVVLAQAPAPASPSEKVIDLYKQGSAALEVKEFNRAIEAFTAIIAQEPGAARAYLGRAIAYHRSGNLDRALADYEQVNRLSKNVQALINAGAILVEKRQYEQALAAYTAALQIEPANTLTLYRRALVHEQLGNFEKCLADYNEILCREPGTAHLYTRRANAYAHFHQHDKAVRDFQKAISLNPIQVDALNGLAWLLATSPRAEVRNAEGAVFYARKACELTEWRVRTYLDTLAAAYAEAGDFAEAVHWARQAIDGADLDGSPGNEPQGSVVQQVKLTGGEYLEVLKRMKLYVQHQAYREP